MTIIPGQGKVLDFQHGEFDDFRGRSAAAFDVDDPEAIGRYSHPSSARP
jgi:hypothetical protein